MSEDKLRDLSELEKQIGRTPGKNRKPETDTDDFKTREMNREEIAQRIRMEMEKQTSQDSSMSATPADPPPAKSETIDPVTEIIPNTITVNRGSEEPSAAPVSTAAGPTEEDDDEPVTVTRDAYPENHHTGSAGTGYSFAAPRRPAVGSSLRLILIIGGVLMAIMVYFILKPKTPDIASGAKTPPPVETTTPDTSKPTDDDDGLAPDPGTRPPEKETPVYTLSAMDYRGKAPIAIKSGGAVWGEKTDPVAAAFCDALKRRAAALHGTRIQSQKEILTETVSGEFNGFRVVAVHQAKAGTTTRDDIAVTLPNRGRLAVNEYVLMSATGTDYEKFQQDVKAAGMEMTVNELSEEGVIAVHVTMRAPKAPAPEPPFTLKENAAGELKLTVDAETVTSIFPENKYLVIDKKILIEDKGKYVDTFKVFYNREEPICYVIIGDENQVAGVQILSARYKTAYGVGLGDTLDKLRVLGLAQGDLQVTMTKAGATYACFPNSAIKFFLEHQQLDFKNRIFPGNAKIVSVLLGESPFMEQRSESASH